MKDITYLQRDFINNDGRLLILSVTKYCNLACKYCKTGKQFTYDQLSSCAEMTHFPKEHFDDIKKVCIAYNVKEVTLTGGEPLEYPYLLELMEFFQNNNIRFSLHTNGVSQNWNKAISFFIEHQLFPDIHLSTELSADLQKNVRGATLPCDLIKKLTVLGCNIELKVTIHQKFLPFTEKLADILDKFIELGVPSIRIQPVFFPYGVSSPLKLEKNSSIIFKKFLDLKKKNKYNQFIRNSEESLLLTIALLETDDIASIKKPVCVGKDKVIFMQPDGKLINCLELWNKKDCEKEFDLVCCGFVA